MTDFQLNEAIAVLSKTPGVLRQWLGGLGDEWVRVTEGPETWSPFDNLGHLIHGERTDWIPRVKIMLEHGAEVPFEPFDRFAQFEASEGLSLDGLLGEFERLRAGRLSELEAMNLTEADLDREGTHPELGPVTMRHLLAAWVVHDLGHIAQIARVMAKRYKDEIGPWPQYLPIVTR